MEQEAFTSVPLVDRVDLAKQDNAEEHQRQKLEHDFEIASQRIADTDAEIARLKAEYLALPEKIRLAERHFQEALRVFNVAKERLFPDS